MSKTLKPALELGAEESEPKLPRSASVAVAASGQAHALRVPGPPHGHLRAVPELCQHSGVAEGFCVLSFVFLQANAGPEAFWS